MKQRGRAVARTIAAVAMALGGGCSSAGPDGGALAADALAADGAAAGGGTDGHQADVTADTTADAGPDPFADRVVSFSPGPTAGYGADALPDVVLGPPHGGGAQAGGTHVVSLGDGGEMVLALDDIVLVDGPGPDLLVFENAFEGWVETAEVALSDDGAHWIAFPCAATATEAGYPGCAGVAPVLAHPDAPEIDPTDPDAAGGDAFDLATLGLSTARFVRLRDTGTNSYAGNSGGFDLDAIAVVHGAPASR